MTASSPLGAVVPFPRRGPAGARPSGPGPGPIDRVGLAPAFLYRVEAEGFSGLITDPVALIRLIHTGTVRRIAVQGVRFAPPGAPRTP